MENGEVELTQKKSRSSRDELNYSLVKWLLGQKSLDFFCILFLNRREDFVGDFVLFWNELIHFDKLIVSPPFLQNIHKCESLGILKQDFVQI